MKYKFFGQESNSCLIYIVYIIFFALKSTQNDNFKLTIDQPVRTWMQSSFDKPLAQQNVGKQRHTEISYLL